MFYGLSQFKVISFLTQGFRGLKASGSLSTGIVSSIQKEIYKTWRIIYLTLPFDEVTHSSNISLNKAIVSRVVYLIDLY